MSFATKILVGGLVLLLAIVLQRFWSLTRSGELPDLSPTQYWGPGDPPKKSPIIVIKPFKIQIQPELIEDLKQQLSRPIKGNDPVEDIAFEYGFNRNHLEEVVTYWRDTYLPKWNEREAYLKKFKHFSTVVQGLRIHFIHAKAEDPGNKKVIPLLLLHGWPGSIREFYDIIPLLITPNDKSDYVFEVIAPSLPGFGWSQAPAKAGFSPVHAAVLFRNFMVQLDYDRFLVQGGDWGSLIGSHMAALYPDNVLGFHSNWCSSLHPLSLLVNLATRKFPSLLGKEKHASFYSPVSEFLNGLYEESGYFHLQTTKPDTVGLALANSPVGLAAYILEKFSTWTNPVHKSLPDGGLTKKFDLDALLDNVMIYYVTNSITSSLRLYKGEALNADIVLSLEKVHIKVPTGCAHFKYELMQHTDCELRLKFKNLIHSKYYEDGGHFAAMELPQVLAADFFEFAKKILKL